MPIYAMLVVISGTSTTIAGICGMIGRTVTATTVTFEPTNAICAMIAGTGNYEFRLCSGGNSPPLFFCGRGTGTQ